MTGNICDGTAIIENTDIRLKLASCFINNRNDLPVQTEPTTTRTTPIIKTRSRILASNEPCGVPKVGIPNVVNGEVIVHGTHPWIAAIFHDEKYFCGGTLVTYKKVVSAAHCYYGKELIRKLAEDITVILGAQQLNKLAEVGRSISGVDKIYIHADWNPQKEKYDADIAVLILAQEVEFSHYIQPACLAKRNNDLKKLNDGIIVGFGKSESSASHENEPRKATTPIVKTVDCLKKFPDLGNIATYRTFCGGFANGTGACTGDSGGGLTVVNAGRHFLRGVVSSSLYSKKYGCNVNAYSIFTDIRFFLTFINDSE
ncbi:serine protease gd-like [Chironomus tepperi]|uniref:serine protease gd-like n=1 Tax=Chironomus tepperi TaxID=113505 RepID=UPI00391FC1BD